MRTHQYICNPCFSIVNRLHLHLHSKAQRPIFHLIFSHLLHQLILHKGFIILPPNLPSCELQMQLHILPLVQVKRVRRGHRNRIFWVLFIEYGEVNDAEVDARDVGVCDRKLGIPRGIESSTTCGEV
ncbi:hypothetical protein PHAVU_001G195200 [Phaseolus vulgaris]|uniref:Uncharacterized protein n=1 Tax=Phaseolus vulgaris TaxID=3885 RepID=V7CXV4_PHAVU|nr:hypothetical protein PHAVU_001G195200g [Phaseolus vulgaris]ESW34959.1 hypothetical protein PHAVU_001G195200g [Phaseolus vulgaris]